MDDQEARRMISSGGDMNLDRSNLAGGDQYIGDHVRGDKVGGDKVGGDKISKRTNVRLGFGVVALVLLLGGGGYVVATTLVPTATDVVSRKGLDGARGTVEAIRDAEVEQDAAEWCRLTSAGSGGTCRTVVASAFTSRPELRAELPEVEIGAVTGSDTSAEVTLTFRGSVAGAVPMRWNGERWEVDRAAYLFSVNNGGLAMTAVLNAHQCGVVLGIDTGCRR